MSSEAESLTPATPVPAVQPVAVPINGSALPDTLRRLSKRRRLLLQFEHLRHVASWTVVACGMAIIGTLTAVYSKDHWGKVAEWLEPEITAKEVVRAAPPIRESREISEKLGYTLPDRQRETFQAARRCIQQFLASPDWNVAMSHLSLDPLTSPNPREFCSFSLLTQWRGVELVRTEERYAEASADGLSKWEARRPNGQRFHFVIEQSASGFRVRWDALEQQLRASFPRFCQDTRSRPGLFYARLKVWEAEANLPLQVLVEDALPGRKADACLATVDPSSPLGRHLLNVLTPGTSVEAVVSLRWESGQVALRGIERDLWANL